MRLTLISSKYRFLTTLQKTFPLSLGLLTIFVITSSNGFAQKASPPPSTATTASGISLDTAWKVRLYEFAKLNVVHPSWGLAHAERNFHLTMDLAKRQHVEVDEDVLFAASFLHDLGGLKNFAKEGVDHAIRSAEISEAILKSQGFPTAKFPDVREMILSHVYYGPASASPVAALFREADILDFLGAIGIARLFAVTLEAGAETSLRDIVKTLTSFAKTFSTQIQSSAGQELARQRTHELNEFLRQLKSESMEGKAL